MLLFESVVLDEDFKPIRASFRLLWILPNSLLSRLAFVFVFRPSGLVATIELDLFLRPFNDVIELELKESSFFFFRCLMRLLGLPRLTGLTRFCRSFLFISTSLSSSSSSRSNLLSLLAPV